MSLMLLHLQSLLGFCTLLVLFLILLNCSLLLALDFINNGARLGGFLHLCKMSASKLVHCFSSYSAAFDSGLLHHQIRSPLLLPIGKMSRVCQDFRLGLVLLLMPLLTQSSYHVSEVCELLIKVHGILDNMSKQVCNSACILVHVLILLPCSIMRSGLGGSVSSRSQGCGSS